LRPVERVLRPRRNPFTCQIAIARRHERHVKLAGPLTLETIADSAIAQGLATREEIEAVVERFA